MLGAAEADVGTPRSVSSQRISVVADLKTSCTTPLSSGGSPPGCSCCSSSSIEEIKTSPLGTTTKKRKAHCRAIMADLSDVCDKYHESLACVLGHSFLYTNENEKKCMTEILNIVTDSKGSKKKRNTHLLLAETTMRVSDWVLLYFKI